MALVASLLLVAMPGAPSSFLLLVRPGAPSSVLAPSSHAITTLEFCVKWLHSLLVSC